MQDKLNEGTSEGEGVTMTNEPQTVPFTFAGQTITFQPEASSGATSNMTATVSLQGGSVVMTGSMTGAGTGFSMTAVFSLTQGP
jgi:hypothetical protein